MLPHHANELTGETRERPADTSAFNAEGGAVGPGSRLGGYYIRRRLATGGMADVYLARPIGGDQTVVLKRLRASRADCEEHVQMLIDEAALLERMDHPNVVRAFDTTRVASEHFFTMEWVKGASLLRIWNASVRRSEKLSLAFAVGVIREAANGLQHAHERKGTDGQSLGVVHRDISPSNLVVDLDGGVRVIDFGVAHASHRLAKTGGRYIKGKRAYMSPQQALGKKLDRRTDVFALGIVLYEITAGRRLFFGDSDYAILDKIVNGRVLAPSKFVPGYPPALEAVVMRALARDPDERFASAAELAEALEEVARELDLDLSNAVRGELVQQLFTKRASRRSRAATTKGPGPGRGVFGEKLALGTIPPHRLDADAPDQHDASGDQETATGHRGNPLAEGTHEALADGWLDEQQCVAAISSYHAHVAAKPADLETRSGYYVARGCAALNSGRREVAARFFELAMQLSPRNEQAMQLLAAAR